MVKPEDPRPEEQKQMLENAQKEVQDEPAKTTPEEHARAQARANRLVDEDYLRKQVLMDRPATVAVGASARTMLVFCANCGSPAGSGTYCTNCGSRLPRSDPEG